MRTLRLPLLFLPLFGTFACDGEPPAKKEPPKKFQPPACFATIEAHDGELYDVAFTPDGASVVTVGYKDYGIRLWSAADGRKLDEKRSEERPTCVAVMPDGGAILVGDVAGRAVRYSLSDGKLGEPKVVVEAGRIFDMALSPDGTRLVTTGFKKPTVLWNLSDGSRVLELKIDEQQRGVAFSPCGKRIVTGGYTNTFSLWDAATGNPTTTTIPKVDPKLSDAASVAFSADGKLIATGHMDSSITVWEVDPVKLRLNTFVRDASTCDLVFSPDSKYLATANQNKTVFIWNLKLGIRAAALTGFENAVKCVAYSRDGKMLAAGCDNGRLKLWR